MSTIAPQPKRVWRLEDCPRPLEAATTDAPKPTTSALPKPIDDGWREWITDNAIRHASTDSMVATMQAVGIDAVEARRAIAELTVSPGYRTACKMRDLRDKLASVMANTQQLQERRPLYNEIEKRSRVSRDEFIERYARGSHPVVLTDLAADWPARMRWTPRQFKQRFGGLTVEVQGDRHSDDNFEVNKLRHKRSTNFGAFLDRIGKAGKSNDEYLTANNELLRRPEFMSLFDDIGSLPDYCDRSRLAQSASLWIGPAGTITPLHHDTLMLFHTQLTGRKRWRFISPMYTSRVYNHLEVFSPLDLDKPNPALHPQAVGLPVLEVVVEPGETLFLPLGWWHQVTSLDLCISFSFTNIAEPNEFTFAMPQIRNW